MQFSRDGKIALMYIDDENRKKQLLTLGPVEYVQTLAEYRAIYGWQTPFVADGQSPPGFGKSLKEQVRALFGVSDG
jgi:hypothetical protein